MVIGMTKEERCVVNMTTLAEVMNGRFEDCMKDLYRNMSAWAEEIYDMDEFNWLTDEQIRLVAEAIENCADLVKTSAKEYGIEV